MHGVIGATGQFFKESGWFLFAKFKGFGVFWVMEAVIISNYALIREGLASIISRFKNMKVNLVVENVKQATSIINERKIDVVFLDLNRNNEEELGLIKQMKGAGVKSRFVIVDFNNSKELFVKAIRSGVEGYILGRANEAEIMHIIEQICRGKKYYDAYFIDSMINEDTSTAQPAGLSQLTAREREILCEIARGRSNREIAAKFFISEHTVKKHINHIFDKLNIRDRTQAALFANSCGIIGKDAC